MASEKISAEISASRKVKNEDGSTSPHPKAGHSTSVDYDFGGNLDSLIALCATGKTEEEAKKIVYSNAVANIRVTMQAGLRRLIEGDKSSEEIQKWASEYIPGAAAQRQKMTKEEKLLKQAAEFDEDELDATLKRLQELKKQKAAA